MLINQMTILIFNTEILFVYNLIKFHSIKRADQASYMREILGILLHEVIYYIFFTPISPLLSLLPNIKGDVSEQLGYKCPKGIMTPNL